MTDLKEFIEESKWKSRRELYDVIEKKVGDVIEDGGLKDDVTFFMMQANGE